jgi:hypothetical protein
MSKKKYAVYKNIDPESDHYCEVFYSLAADKQQVGEIHGGNECVLITDNFELVMNLIKTK